MPVGGWGYLAVAPPSGRWASSLFRSTATWPGCHVVGRGGGETSGAHAAICCAEVQTGGASLIRLGRLLGVAQSPALPPAEINMRVRSAAGIRRALWLGTRRCRAPCASGCRSRTTRSGDHREGADANKRTPVGRCWLRPTPRMLASCDAQVPLVRRPLFPGPSCRLQPPRRRVPLISYQVGRPSSRAKSYRFAVARLPRLLMIRQSSSMAVRTAEAESIRLTSQRSPPTLATPRTPERTPRSRGCATSRSAAEQRAASAYERALPWFDSSNGAGLATPTPLRACRYVRNSRCSALVGLPNRPRPADNVGGL